MCRETIKYSIYVNKFSTHTHARLTAIFLGLPRRAGTRKIKPIWTNLDFTEARDSEWQWHQLGHMQDAPRSRQITMPVPHHSSFLQTGCPSCSPTNNVKVLKALYNKFSKIFIVTKTLGIKFAEIIYSD